MSNWKKLEEAPRDGTPVLLVRNNGCSWDHVVAWYSPIRNLWISEDIEHFQERWHYWTDLPEPPYDICSEDAEHHRTSTYGVE
jgi:hypothetical protein